MNDEVHPASDAPPPASRPDAAHLSAAQGVTAEEIVEAELVEPAAASSAGPQIYVVPQRFGMSAILGIMTALAVLFGILQSLDAHPFTYLFLGVLSLVICIVQMFFGGVPRVASVAAGTVVFAIFVLSIPFVTPRVPLEAVVFLFVLSLPFGGLLGYLTGTCAAGIFLVMDQLERYFQARRGTALATPATGGAP